MNIPRALWERPSPRLFDQPGSLKLKIFARPKRCILECHEVWARSLTTRSFANAASAGNTLFSTNAVNSVSNQYWRRLKSSWISDPRGYPAELQDFAQSTVEAKHVNDGRRMVPCKAYIALGSNIGDRIQTIENACRELNKANLKVLRTSALYETTPMYVEDQNPFINGVCEVQVEDCTPIGLLDRLKKIEKDLGRQKTVENGPREIDLDILLYGDEVVEHERLTVPHKSMLEREFVLRPLCDLIPNGSPPHDPSNTAYKNYHATVYNKSSRLSPLTPLSTFLPPIASLTFSRKTHVMAILNLTTDSFSDGGHHSSNPRLLGSMLHRWKEAGATIFDIGGQSTRPGSPEVSTEEELSRILPTIRFVRSLPEFRSIAISVDTYRASVASAAIEAGADMINDVSAGTMDLDMLPTVAKLGCTIILMHMRGTPSTMSELTMYPNGLIKTVAKELQERVRAAEQAGIFRWRIMLDPGIGFAKKSWHNLKLLGHFNELRRTIGLRGFPWVIGASRKSFIGEVTGVALPADRKMGTAVAVAASVQGGADVVRVHDVEAMSQVIKMSDALWRPVIGATKSERTY